MYLCVQCAKHPQHAYSRGSVGMPPAENFGKLDVRKVNLTAF